MIALAFVDLEALAEQRERPTTGKELAEAAERRDVRGTAIVGDRPRARIEPRCRR